MVSLPSSRKLAYPAIVLLAAIISIRLFITLRDRISNNPGGLLLLRMQGKPVVLQSAANLDLELSLEHNFITNYHTSHPIPPSNDHLVRLLSKCNHRSNPNTNHIRLPTTSILNISMIPSDPSLTPAEIDNIKNNRYFNPAILPLPPYIAQQESTKGYKYVLLSRLVTDGTHQKSHICFADICTSPSTPKGKSRACTDQDLELLGGHGGMRCITKPEALNIPPTPSRKCTGSWSSFPDIPGFHDPRIFWSGRGEPLVEVNSGSQYGCVGLWLVDLRAVWPRLDDVMKGNKGRAEHNIELRDKTQKADKAGTKGREFDLAALGAPTGYPQLTEITKNARSSRSEVEKNWVLFFPRDGEAWVQYEMMGKIEGHEEIISQNAEERSDVRLDATKPSPSAGRGGTPIENSRAPTETALMTSEKSVDVVLELIEGTAPLLDVVETETPLAIATLEHDKGLATLLEPELKNLIFENGPAKRDEPGPMISIASLASEPAPTLTSDYNNVGKPQEKDRLETTSTRSFEFSSRVSGVQKDAITPIISGGRTIAQLLSHGYTTTNLTSPQEPPCFNLFDRVLTHDPLGNIGHWHQGSNSLRLVLCTREQLHQRTCIPASSTSADVPPEHKVMTTAQYEQLLIEEGLIVHFSIVHRKFNNEWGLPMRYERYFLLWEARRPFRTVAVSEYPILFGNERARPWTWEEDLGRDRAQKPEAREPADEEGKAETGHGKEDGKAAYFTYTPSIAWAWRARDQDAHTGQDEYRQTLGNGFLEDDVIVGIGMDDVRQGFIQVKVEEVLECLRFCPSIVQKSGKQ